ncbi:MAG: FAD-dependent thymidylate synthase [Candidatus Micrarchaeia archaeon]
METKLKVVLLRHTSDPERVCAAAARQCYSSAGVAELQEKMTDEQVVKLINQVIRSGHHSTIEHASFTFAVEGISRACSHQLVRHRVASFSQQSQRYVNAKDVAYVIPPKIRAKPELKEKYEAFMAQAQKVYNELADAGIEKEDARFVLPNAAETRLVVTMNARELLHFFELRTCNRAQWEIHLLANKMLEECRKVAPNIFRHAGPSCETEKICWEGKLACDRWKGVPGAEVRERE